jgi:sec-independent protein translocase protein TatA
MNLGAPEILVILVVALLVFGPHRLPEIGRQVGGAMRELRKMQDSVKSELQAVMQEDAPSYEANTIKPVSATPSEVSASALDAPTTGPAPVPAAEVDGVAEVEPVDGVDEPDHSDTEHGAPPSKPESGFEGPSGSFR